MASAIQFDGLIQSGKVANYSELARLGNVTRARMTQIMNLLMLAPEIQEQLLFLPRVEAGREEVCLRDLQSVASAMEWRRQTDLSEISSTDTNRRDGTSIRKRSSEYVCEFAVLSKPLDL